MAKRPEVIPQLQALSVASGVPWQNITINRWKTDTCECVLEQWFDDTKTPRTVLYARTLESCPAHPTPGEAQWSTVGAENARKNGALAIVEGLIGKDVKEDKTTWAFSSNRISGTDERVLELTIATNKPNRAAVESAADVQFGAGAIRVS